MNELKYTITKFDQENKIVVVTFADGGWAEIGLTNPLPKNIEELEDVIKRFTSPVEALEARTNPDADLSYIDPLVGTERTTERLRLLKDPETTGPGTGALEIDPEAEANIRMWEDVAFQNKVGEALVKLGVITENPTVIPVTTL
jgi:hypothetical protein